MLWQWSNLKEDNPSILVLKGAAFEDKIQLDFCRPISWAPFYVPCGFHFQREMLDKFPCIVGMVRESGKVTALALISNTAIVEAQVEQDSKTQQLTLSNFHGKGGAQRPATKNEALMLASKLELSITKALEAEATANEKRLTRRRAK